MLYCQSKVLKMSRLDRFFKRIVRYDIGTVKTRVEQTMELKIRTVHHKQKHCHFHISTVTLTIIYLFLLNYIR
jgi:hypothetical protein